MLRFGSTVRHLTPRPSSNDDSPPPTTRDPKGASRAMRKIKWRWIVPGVVLSFLLLGSALVWVSLTHTPEFYRAAATLPPERRQEEAKRFVAQSLQLYNDIAN